MMYNIQIGQDLQTVLFEGSIQELVKELKLCDWWYGESFDSSHVTIHSDFGKNITSINEIPGDNETKKIDEASPNIH